MEIDARRYRGTLLVPLLLVALLFAGLPGAAEARPRDRTRPKITMETEDGAVLVGPSRVTGMRISGRVTDNRRVRHVFVTTYTEMSTPVSGSASATLQFASLRCRNQRRTCTWSIPVPEDAGEYEIRAVAQDTSGNRRRTKAIETIVVNEPSSIPPWWFPL